MTTELSDEDRSCLREYAFECICDDMETAVDYLGMQDEIIDQVDEVIHGLDDTELSETAEEYSGLTVGEMLDEDE